MAASQENERILAGSTRQSILTLFTRKPVVATAAVDGVVAIAAKQLVAALAAVQRIVAAKAEERVGSLPAGDAVVQRAPVKRSAKREPPGVVAKLATTPPFVVMSAVAHFGLFALGVEEAVADAFEGQAHTVADIPHFADARDKQAREAERPDDRLAAVARGDGAVDDRAGEGLAEADLLQELRQPSSKAKTTSERAGLERSAFDASAARPPLLPKLTL